MSEKKDVLEFPLEELEVPQAIVLMMQAAVNTCVSADVSIHQYEVDNNRLQLLCEKLEGYFEDKLEEAKTSEGPPDEPEEEMYPAADDSDTFLNLVDGEVYQVVHKGVVFGKLCNERVTSIPEIGITTTCIKEFGHQLPDHEDKDGNIR